MKLYLSKDKSDDSSRFIVYDERACQRYKVVGRHVRSGERMYILCDDLQLVTLRDTKIAGLRSYYVHMFDDSFHVIITKRRSGFSVSIHGVSWHIVGDVLKKSYSILDIDNTVVASICRHHTAVGEAYEVDIIDKTNELYCIAIAVCVESICTLESFAVQTI